MKYMGSKARHAKQLLPLVLAGRKHGQFYVEPFVGGANMFDKVAGPRLGNDTNEYLIACLRALEAGWLPPVDIDSKQYDYIRTNYKDLPKELVGYAAFQLSYGAQWFGSYRRDNTGLRNYSREAYNNVSKQAINLKGAVFTCQSYDEMQIPNASIVYCDPPYADTAMYKGNATNFDSRKFWIWAKQLALSGHTVFVSEYQAPEDWACIWQKEVNSSLSKDTGGKKAVEKLFVYRGIDLAKSTQDRGAN